MDNINPYHDYGDLPLIDQITTEIKTASADKKLTLPNIERGGEKVWNFDAYSRCFGFNLCPTKEDLEEKRCKSAPTLIWMGEVRPYTHIEKARLKKDGTPYKRKWKLEDEREKGRVEPQYDPETHTWIYHTSKAVMEYFSKPTCGFSFLPKCILLG